MSVTREINTPVFLSAVAYLNYYDIIVIGSSLYIFFSEIVPNFGKLNTKGVANLNNKYCGTDCLRYELDENGEMLLETAEQLGDKMEEDGFVTVEQLQRLEKDIGIFVTDFAIFQSECGKCANFKVDGKVKQYQDILEKMQAFLENLRTD